MLFIITIGDVCKFIGTSTECLDYLRKNKLGGYVQRKNKRRWRRFAWTPRVTISSYY